MRPCKFKQKTIWEGGYFHQFMLSSDDILCAIVEDTNGKVYEIPILDSKFQFTDTYCSEPALLDFIDKKCKVTLALPDSTKKYTGKLKKILVNDNVCRIDIGKESISFNREGLEICLIEYAEKLKAK